MKTKNLFYALFTAAVATVTFSSCEKEDDASGNGGKIISGNFISDGTEVANPYSLSIDPSTGNIYIGTSDYLTDGDMYVFSPEGKLLKKFDTGGLNPMGAYPIPGKGMFILNSGNQGNSNSNLAFYDFESGDVARNVYADQNGEGLGDTGQDLLVYGSKVYVAVSGSGLIRVLDKSGKKISTIRSDKEGIPQSPRSLTSLDGKVYVTYFDGYLAKIDTASLTVEAQVQVGRYPEYVRAANNKLYVANSGGLDFPNYGKTVSVIDPATFTKIKDIEVALNPDKLAVDGDGNVFVISNGNYGDVPSALQKINTRTDEMKDLNMTATYMAIHGTKMYIIDSQFDENWNSVNTFLIYNIK
ncbi:MAG: hypothetical protein LBR34_06760 [Prevotella sp.]|jgi:DNA-binding beta-propeller fold protein YncE|nr:hypothetical protein [Prevotella sp.]